MRLLAWFASGWLAVGALCWWVFVRRAETGAAATDFERGAAFLLSLLLWPLIVAVEWCDRVWPALIRLGRAPLVALGWFLRRVLGAR